MTSNDVNDTNNPKTVFHKNLNIFSVIISFHPGSVLVPPVIDRICRVTVIRRRFFPHKYKDLTKLVVRSFVLAPFMFLLHLLIGNSEKFRLLFPKSSGCVILLFV